MGKELGHTLPKHLGAEHLRAYILKKVIDPGMAASVMKEAYDSELIRGPVKKEGGVAQDFSTLPVDHTRENSFFQLELLGSYLHRLVVPQVAEIFPAVNNFRIDESIAQIYKPSENEAIKLGWHRDLAKDHYLTISAHLDGIIGEIDFTHIGPIPSDRSQAEVIQTLETSALDVVVFACSKLWQSEEANINRGHRVRIPPAPDAHSRPRYTVQFRMGVNAGTYGNHAVNRASPPKTGNRGQI